VDKTGRTVERDRLLPSDQQAEQAVEAEEMIEMGVRNKDLVDPQKPTRGQRRDITEIEEDGAPLEQRLDEDRRIAEAAVDQHGVKQRPHFFLPGRARGAPRLFSDFRSRYGLSGSLQERRLTAPCPTPPCGLGSAKPE